MSETTICRGCGAMGSEPHHPGCQVAFSSIPIEVDETALPNEWALVSNGPDGQFVRSLGTQYVLDTGRPYRHLSPEDLGKKLEAVYRELYLSSSRLTPARRALLEQREREIKEEFFRSDESEAIRRALEPEG